VLSKNDAVISAFNQLWSAARDLQAKTGRCLGANLKLELRRRSSWAFNEQQLGFPRFGDFLRAAQMGGYIRLQPTPGGDLQIIPQDRLAPVSQDLSSRSFPLPNEPQFRATQLVQAEPASSPMPVASLNVMEDAVRPMESWRAPVASSVVRVRQDLWNAFNNVYDEWVYDRSQDRAMRKSAAERSENATLANLIPIPSGRQLLTEWILKFADTQPPERKDRLVNLLKEPNAPLNFLSEARRNASLQREWHRFHVQRAVQTIQDWSVRNAVQPKNVATQRLRAPKEVASAPYQVPTQSPTPFSAKVDSTPDSKKVLADKLAGVIDEMVERLITLRGLIAIVNRQT
jgi:hypothetical protein